MSGNGSDLNAPDLNGWGIDNDYGVLRDVLLGKPDHFEWRPISQIAKPSIRIRPMPISATRSNINSVVMIYTMNSLSAESSASISSSRPILTRRQSGK